MQWLDKFKKNRHVPLPEQAPMDIGERFNALNVMLEYEDVKVPGVNHLALLEQDIKTDPLVLQENHGIVTRQTSHHILQSVLKEYASSLSEKSWNDRVSGFFPKDIYDEITKVGGAFDRAVAAYLEAPNEHWKSGR